MYLGSSPRRSASKIPLQCRKRGNEIRKARVPGTEKAPQEAHCERARHDIADKPMGGLAVIQHEKVQHAAGDDNPME